MTRKKGNMCTKCGVRHVAPTGKKCAFVKETENPTLDSQPGSVSNGIQVLPLEVPKAVDADHLAPAVDVEERMDVVEHSVSEMKSMMAQVLTAVGVKETDQELTESQVEATSEDNGFEQVRSRKKKKSKRTYLDDFLVLGHTKEEAQLAQNIVIKILRYLGFYISWAKVTPPSQICRYLGLDIDSIEMELRLPKDKLEKLILSVNTFKDKSSISKKELESLGGLLSHCSHVVDGGRTHSRRFYDLYKVILNNNLKRIKLGLAAKEDLKWWANFAKTFNGKKKIIYPEYELPLVSDSSLKGFAIYKGEEWLAGSWDDSLKLDNDKCNHIISSPSFDDYDKTNINELELWPIISGLRVWYPDLKGKSVSIFTDNTQVYHMVRKGTSSNKTCMQWLREIFWICKIYKIRLVPYYINTKNNLVADTLSRLLYIKGESEAKKCLNGTGLCCLQKIFDCCRKPGQES